MAKLLERVNNSNAFECNNENSYELYSYFTFIARFYLDETYDEWCIEVNISKKFDDKPAFACTATTRRHFGLWLKRMGRRLNVCHELDYCEIRDWYDFMVKTNQLDKSLYLNAGCRLVFIYA